LSQAFGLEGVMARKMNALKNLVSLMLLAWSFLMNAEENAAELKELGQADRIKKKKQTRKEKTRPAFPYYSILKGMADALFPCHDCITALLAKTG